MIQFKKRDYPVSVLLLLLIISIKMIAQYFAIDPVYDLHRDEYLHLDQANHLAWGFESVPPFTSWIAWIIKFLGNTVFWVKFFPALFGAATIVTAWKITASLGGKLFAQTLTATALLFSLLMRMNTLFQPNSFDIFSWTIIYYLLIRYLQTREMRWLYFMAIAFALGFLNKYSIVFLLFSVFGGLLISSERQIFTKPDFYKAMLLGLLLILPNLCWQYSHGFPVIWHMKELASTQLVHVKRADFLKDQLLFFFQALIIIFTGFAGFILYRPFRKFSVIPASYMICLLLFCFLRAKSYYAIGLYPVLIAFGAVYLEYILRNGWQRYLKPLVFALVIIGFYPFAIRMPFVTPEKIMHKAPFSKTGPHIWEDGRDHGFPQDFADMLGWQELAHKTDSVYKTLDPKEYSLVWTDNYGQAGAINYYSPLHAVSENADYINWFDLSKPGRNIILVKEKGDTDAFKQTPYFEKVFAADSIVNPLARENGTVIYVLYHAKGQVNEVIKSRIAADKLKIGLP